MFDHAALHGDGAFDRVDDTCELDQHAIAHQFHDTSATFGNRRIDERRAVRLQRGQRTGLIGLHQARETDHVCGQYGG